MAIEFRLLGDVEVWRDGQRLPIGPAQLRRTLAALLVDANRTVPVDQLLERVWGERPLPRRPRAAVQHNVARLRSALSSAQDEVQITWRPAGYLLSVTANTVDLHQFHGLISQARGASGNDLAVTLLTQALRLWRGEPFTGLDTPWFTIRRTMLTGQRHAAMLDLTDLQLRGGQHAALVSGLAHEAGQHPLDERLAAQLMLALYRSGNQAGALEHYEQVRQRLAEGLRTAPSPPLQQLHQQILTAHPALTVPTAMSSPPAPISLTDQPPGSSAPAAGSPRRSRRPRLRGLSHRAKALIAASAVMVVTAPVALAAFYANESPPAVPAGRWLAGMNSLQRHLNEGLPQKAVIITPARLRHEAALLRTCTTGLAKLGIPTDDFQQNYQQARQACTYFDRAAACDTAAASAYTTAPGGPAADKFQRLINCSDTGVNKGIEFLSFATGAGPA